MAHRRRAAASDAGRLSPEEIALLEKLVNDGALIAVPPKPGKPRGVIAAALAEGGSKIALYLSATTVTLG